MISNDHNVSDSASRSMSFGSSDSNEKMGSFTNSYISAHSDLLNVEAKSVNAQKKICMTGLKEVVPHLDFSVTNAPSKHSKNIFSSEHSSHHTLDSRPHLLDYVLTNSLNSDSVHECLSQTPFLDLKNSILTLVEQPIDTCIIHPNFPKKMNKNIVRAKRKFPLKKKIVSALVTSLVFNSLQLMEKKNLKNTPRTIDNNLNGYGILPKFQMDTYYLILEYSELLQENDKEKGWFSLLRRSLLLIDLFLYLNRLYNISQLIPLQEKICFSCASLMKTEDLFCKVCKEKLGYLDYLITALTSDASFTMYDSTLGILILVSFYHYSLKLLCEYVSQQMYSTINTRNRSSQKKNFTQKKPIQCDTAFFSNLDSLTHVLLFNNSLEDINSKILYIKNSIQSCEDKKSNVSESVLVSSFNRLCQLRLSLAETTVPKRKQFFSSNPTLSSSFPSDENEEMSDKTDTMEQYEIKTSIPRYIVCDLVLQVCDMIKNGKSVKNKVLDLAHLSMCIGIITGYLTEIMMTDVTKESVLLEELLLLVLQCVTETLAYRINWMQRIIAGKQKTPCDYPPPSISIFSVLDNVVTKFCKQSTLLKKIKSSFLQKLHTEISQNTFKKPSPNKDVEDDASIHMKDIKNGDKDHHTISRCFWVSASASLVNDIVVKNRQTLLHTWKIHLKTLLSGSSIVKIGLHTNASALTQNISPQVTHFASSFPVIQWAQPSYPHIFYIKQKKNVSQNGKDFYDDCTCLKIVESRAILRLDFDLVDPHIISVLKSCQSKEALATINFFDEKNDSQEPVFLKFLSKTEDVVLKKKAFFKNSGMYSNNKVYGLSSIAEILNLPNKSSTSWNTETIFPYGLDISSQALNALMVKKIPELLKRHEYLNFLNLMLVIQPEALVQSTSNIFVECTIYTDSFYQNFISNNPSKSVSGVALAWLKNVLKTPQSIDSILHNDYTLNHDGLLSKSQSSLLYSGKRHLNTPNKIHETTQKRSKTIKTNLQVSPLCNNEISQAHIFNQRLNKINSESSVFSYSESASHTTRHLLTDQLLNTQTSGTATKQQTDCLVFGNDTRHKRTPRNSVLEKKTLENLTKTQIYHYTEKNRLDLSCGTTHSEESPNDIRPSGDSKKKLVLRNVLSERERRHSDLLQREGTNVRHELKKEDDDILDLNQQHQVDEKYITGNGTTKSNNIGKAMKTLPHARFWIWDVNISISSRCSRKSCKRTEKGITQVSENVNRHETVVGKQNTTFQSIIYYCGPILAGDACRRVFKRRQIIISKKLQLFQDVVKLSRVLFQYWRRALFLFDCVQQNEYDLFAWGILPVRAIHHPNLWVPLPTGFFDADSYDMSSIKTKKNISKETSVPLMTKRASHLNLPKKIVCKNQRKTNCSWLSRTLSKYFRTSSKNYQTILSQFDSKIRRRNRPGNFQKSLAINRHRLSVNSNYTKIHNNESLPFNFSYEPFSIHDFVQRQKVFKFLSPKTSPENKPFPFRSSFPLLRGSKVVEIEIQQENRASLAKSVHT
ncbi:uncharacterized protein LOC128884477 [Hylaeus volcanicus]|uniref:uncharacterized protein LOC128884477 n=1 Tax=Hylaeus volcanicus TaxID=313075 RepID=UPI0023B84CD2|nr:uncharacterized protein LOC128884477 [Hylaeus volcanicus]